MNSNVVLLLLPKQFLLCVKVPHSSFSLNYDRGCLCTQRAKRSDTVDYIAEYIFLWHTRGLWVRIEHFKRRVRHDLSDAALVQRIKTPTTIRESRRCVPVTGKVVHKHINDNWFLDLRSHFWKRFAMYLGYAGKLCALTNNCFLFWFVVVVVVFLFFFRSTQQFLKAVARWRVPCSLQVSFVHWQIIGF
jgi:hypothetical protein